MIEAAAIVDRSARAAAVNALVGRPYEPGGNGPSAFDCYGLTRHLQALFFGRNLPPFFMPRGAGRFAIATAIASHPQRALWSAVPHAVDGAIAVMSRQDCGYHMGTWLDLDGGVIVHAIEHAGVSVDRPFGLTAPAGGRWRINWHVPAAVAVATERVAA